MDGVGFLIFLCFAFTFGPPLLCLIIGLAKHNKDRAIAKVLYIVGALWLIIGGGICASIMTGA